MAYTYQGPGSQAKVAVKNPVKKAAYQKQADKEHNSLMAIANRDIYWSGHPPEKRKRRA